MTDEAFQFVFKIEETIKKRVPINAKVTYNRLIDELKERYNNINCIKIAIENLIKDKIFT